jgi:hypothetical protein
MRNRSGWNDSSATQSLNSVCVVCMAVPVAVFNDDRSASAQLHLGGFPGFRSLLMLLGIHLLLTYRLPELIIRGRCIGI